MSENDDTAKESQIEQSLINNLAERLGLSYMTNTVNGWTSVESNSPRLSHGELGLIARILSKLAKGWELTPPPPPLPMAQRPGE